MKMSIHNIDFFRYFILLITSSFCTFYIYKKSKNLNLKWHLKIYSSLGIVLVSALGTVLRLNQIEYYRLIFIILIILFCTSLDIKNYFSSIPLSLISSGISYGLEIISVIITGTILFFIGINSSNIINDIFSSILQIILTLLFMKIRRFRNGIAFFNTKNNFEIGLFISGPILIIECLYKESMSVATITIFAIGIIISSLGLFFWIKRKITLHYRKRLKLRAEEYSKIELAEKSKEIEKLSNENTSLSSIIHLDNHIMQSLESELKALNSTELTDKLLTSINQRDEYVNDLLIKSKNLASTGNADIDAVLLDLYIKSASRGIDYNLSADCNINYLLNNIISLSGFEALLRNLITNSIVDIENNPEIPGRISIKISQPNDIYELTVMDNGISIENNNSIPDIVKKSNASILINKFDNNDSFTKSITIRFDGLSKK